MIKNSQYIELANDKHKFIIDTASPNYILKKNGELSSTLLGYSAINGNKVVIKKLHHRLMSKKEAIHRFVHELAFQVDHPNIVCSKDIVYCDDNIYLVRDFVEGIDLKTFAEQQNSKVSKELVLQCALEVLKGLEALHSNKIVHCDIKPSNIILEFDPKTHILESKKPSVKIIDFGLAHYLDDKPLSINSKLPFSFIYSPPEQVLGYWDLINKTCDIFSLGVTIYELISQQTPFWHENPLMVMQLQIAQQLQNNGNVDDVLFSILSKATIKPAFNKPPRMYSKHALFNLLVESQKMRYQSAGDFGIVLQDYLDDNKSAKA